MPRKLPKDGMFDTVRTTNLVKRRNILYRLICRHLSRTRYERTDHRSGPGWMSDSYEGVACIHCGTIISEVQTY